MIIKVKYFDEKMPKLVKNEKGDWIDLRVANAFVCDNNEDDIKAVIKKRMVDEWSDDRIYFGEGDVVIMRLGVAIELPADKKADVLSRSSTFASYGLILTNGVGCIDYVYKGDADEWLAVYYATREGFITQYDRVCQFEATDRMVAELVEAEHLGTENRGGHGTSGNK